MGAGRCPAEEKHVAVVGLRRVAASAVVTF
jgi:hypothetical protein